jgi:hypothetical protein
MSIEQKVFSLLIFSIDPAFTPVGALLALSVSECAGERSSQKGSTQICLDNGSGSTTIQQQDRPPRTIKLTTPSDMATGVNANLSRKDGAIAVSEPSIKSRYIDRDRKRREMSFFGDTKQTVNRFSEHIDEFQALYKRRGLAFGSPKDIWLFVKLLKTNRSFRKELVLLGNSVIRREGGKVSLTILFTIIAVSIGGLGIAGMGSAFGLPAAALAAILGSIGFGLGQEIDTAINPNVATKEKDPSPKQPEPAVVHEAEQTIDAEFVDVSPPDRIFEIVEMMQALDESLTPIAEITSANNDLLQTVLERIEETKTAVSATRQSSDDLLSLSASEFSALKSMADSFLIEWREVNETQKMAMKKLSILTYLCTGLALLLVAAMVVLLVHESHLFGR